MYNSFKMMWAVLSLCLGFGFLFQADFSYAEESSKGIGPVTDLKLEALSESLATEGKKTFDAKCTACHKMGEKYTGPMLKGASIRRTPEWIMNMILNPAEMVEKDSVAQELLGEFLVKMPFMDVTQEQARALLEYIRYYDEKGEIQNVPTKEEKPAKTNETKKPVNKKKK
jgi:mono/diheme cytochrome c family protein